MQNFMLFDNNGNPLIPASSGPPLTRPFPFPLQSSGSIVSSLLLALLLAAILPAVLLSPRPAYAQVGEDAPLFREIATMDSLLFVEGFNGCDLSTTRSVLAEELDFYHDQSGIQDKPQFMAAIEQNICSSPERKPIRRLVGGSMEVFPLYRDGTLYGALQSGQHEFYIQEPEKQPYKTSIAQFTHVWIRDGEEWRLTEVLSYDHQASSE
ncbi:nuclear transport factor 2 family protein [Salinibacter sp. 10B]|uniref:nuclear transport factor 2 family protein n=1 Tax=Salinibacter sp. 10B TaxID=1923971 RepID=UPI000CF4CF82|nr:nuclear transport factor 2 family protein [Salinibacter sp. 10B]